MKAMLAAMLIALGSCGLAEAADLAGSWVVKADFGHGLNYTLLCGFSGAGQDVAGPCATVQGKLLSGSGSLDPNRIRFKYSSDYNGSGLDQAYSGAVQPDGSYKGGVSNRLGTGAFQGRLISGSVAGPLSVWRFNVNFDAGIQYVLVCSFKTAGSEVRGPCAIVDNAVLDTRGGSDAAKATFVYDTVFQGAPSHVSYDGAFQANGSLKGDVTSGGSTGTFVASRK